MPPAPRQPPSKSRRRYLAEQVERDLERKMVFLTGPRQVGKTTLARDLPGATAGYLNWDVPEHRERILRRELPQVGADGRKDFESPEGIRVAPASRLLAQLV